MTVEEGAIMSKSYNSLRVDLIRTADDKEYRHAYAEESQNLSIATQIKVMREQRGITQQALAEKSGMKQSMISRYEDVNYSSWSINTLRKLSKALDVDLEVRFRSFREMVESVDNFNRAALQVPAFTEDPFFEPLQPAAEDQLGSVVIAPAAGRASGSSTALATGAAVQRKPKSPSAASAARGVIRIVGEQTA